jgi:hypothetical protein
MKKSLSTTHSWHRELTYRLTAFPFLCHGQDNLRGPEKTVVASNISPRGRRARCHLVRWIKRGRMQAIHARQGDPHAIAAQFASFVAENVSNMQQVAIAYKLLVQRNSRRAWPNFLHF